MPKELLELTPAILEDFRAGLRHAQVPLGDEMEPGLSDAEIDGIGQDLGVAIPPELRTLWRWGIAPRRPASFASWRAVPTHELWPPEQVLRQTELYRMGEEISPGAIAFGGPGGKGWLLVEGDLTAALSPVTYAFHDDPSTLQASPSLGALFADWAGQLKRRDYYLDESLAWQPKDRPHPLPRRILDDSD